MSSDATSLEEVIDQIDEAREEEDQVSFEQVLDAVGRRAFGPLLVVAGIIVLAPVVGDVPGMPTAVGVFVALVTAQLVIGRKRFWLPKWMLRRSVSSEKLDKPLRWLRKPAKVVDHVLRQRLPLLVEGTASRVVAGVCLLVAALLPVMEFVPFSANIGGVILTAFGLALIAKDGLMALIGGVATVGALALVVWGLF